MNASRLYLIVGAVLVAVIVVVILLPEDQGTPQVQEGAQVPSDHPNIEGMTGNQAGAGNVRQDFMAEYKRLGEKIAAQPESDTSDVLVYARMLLDSHQAGKALPLFERYSAAAPQNIPVLLDLSVAYFESQKPEKAEKVTRRVLSIDPKNTTAMYNLGALYAARGEKDKAREIWNSLISGYPDSPDAGRAKAMMEQL